MDHDVCPWFKSTFCNPNTACVEVLLTRDLALVRHSKDPRGPVLVFDRAEWEAFLRGVQDGQFAMPA